jgi:hypothetical protein
VRNIQTSTFGRYKTRVRTRIQIDGSYKGNVNTEPPVRSAAFETAKRADRKGSGGSSRRRNNERRPTRLTFRAIGTNLIFRKRHEHLEALFEDFLIVGHGGFRCVRNFVFFQLQLSLAVPRFLCDTFDLVKGEVV